MNEYVFKKNAENKLDYVGDFDSLYSNVDDPWGQSAVDRGEYLISRKKQIEIISSHKSSGQLLDVGCGLGFTTNEYSKLFDSTGMDISKIAIAKAKHRFPNLRFITHDIRLDFDDGSLYDFIIMNQLLWYVLFDFRAALNTLVKHLKSDGIILISNFIFDKNNQKYGKECFFGHAEILNWIEEEAHSVGLNVQSYICSKLDKKYFDFHCVLSLC